MIDVKVSARGRRNKNKVTFETTMGSGPASFGLEG